MSIHRNLRGELDDVGEAIRPPEIADVLAANDEAILRYETAQDAVQVAKSKVRQAKELDAAERREALAAGKDLPKVLDRHEAAALADVDRAKAVKAATLDLTGPPAAAARRAIREHLPEIEATARERAVEIGIRYRSVLRELIGIRAEYVPALTDWHQITNERIYLFVEAQSKLAGRRVDAPRHWAPTPDGVVGRSRTNPAEALDDILKLDAVRHVPKPARFKSDAERIAWERNVDNPDAWDFDGRPNTQSADDWDARTNTAGGRITQVYV